MTKVKASSEYEASDEMEIPTGHPLLHRKVIKTATKFN